MVWLLIGNRKISGDETTGHEWDGIEELDNPLPFWWVGMFVVSIVFAIGYLIFYPGLGNFTGAGGWTSAGEHDRAAARHEQRFAPLYAELGAMQAEALVEDRMSMQVGRRLFLNHCATCHGSSAQGTRGFPDLTDDEWIWGGEFAAIKSSIANGRTAMMAPWQSALGDDGVRNVAHYVRRLSGQDHDTAKASAGQAQFNTFCMACHGTDGTGNALLGAPDLTNDSWLYGGTLADITQTIAQGRRGEMPPYGELLGADRTHVLAAYITSLSK